MEVYSKITVSGVLQEGIGVGLKNAVSLVGAVFLWLITIWIPYLNVGTTIAIYNIPIELSKGKIISPTFIFDAKYRKFMGEFFILAGLESLAVTAAMTFLVIPGIVISIAWSLSYYIMFDKEIAPLEALIRSNKATYGYKWTIFLVQLVIVIATCVVCGILALILSNFLLFILLLAVLVCVMAISLGCTSVVYKKLTNEDETQQMESEIADFE